MAVILVIAFHSGFTFLEGGFVGVDVFFVISGYLITSLIYMEIREQRFSFLDFYRRRVSRLLPSLVVLLVAVLVFGSIFYDEKAFDNLGKEVFFSSLGLANILFAQGESYFASEEAYRPLIHLWSLGVEEQFYAVWPLLLLLMVGVGIKRPIALTTLLAAVSLVLSELAAGDNDSVRGYFLPQYRAFELLIGASIALVKADEHHEPQVARYSSGCLPWLGAGMILISATGLDAKNDFPGVNALWPCLGTALIIWHGSRGGLARLLAARPVVWVGLISYPLYLFHQPVIAGIELFLGEQPPWLVFLSVLSLATPLAWLSYRFLEIPARRYARRTRSGRGLLVYGSLPVVLLAAAGFVVAKSNGLEARFRILNPFAFEVARAHSPTFHRHYERGWHMSAERERPTALFIGDSVLQQYVEPLVESLELDRDNVDVVSRGACVLLKGVEFDDQSADISCNELRGRLYEIDRTYDYVIISQHWSVYGNRIRNFPEGVDGDARWAGFIQNTVEHFRPLSREVMVIGPHIHVSGIHRLQPTIFIDLDGYRDNLKRLRVEDLDALSRADAYFDRLSRRLAFQYLSPYRIFCEATCRISDADWSFFSDREHLTGISQAFVVARLQALYPRQAVEVPR